MNPSRRWFALFVLVTAMVMLSGVSLSDGQFRLVSGGGGVPSQWEPGEPQVSPAVRPLPTIGRVTRAPSR